MFILKILLHLFIVCVVFVSRMSVIVDTVDTFHMSLSNQQE